MAGKQPAFQFYPGDWRRDTQVQMASMETRGVWIEILCCMWDAPERGKLTGTMTGLSRLIGCDIETLARAVSDIKLIGIGNVTCNGDVTNCNTIVTVINRRMHKENIDRINTRLRVQKHRSNNSCNSGSNGDVTPPSSSSSSSSSSSTKVLMELSDDNSSPEPKKTSASEEHDSPIFITLTLNDKTEYPITDKLIASMSELYPAVDVKQEFRGMRGWLDADTTRRKTRRGIKRFYNGWLSREQDKGKISYSHKGKQLDVFHNEPITEYGGFIDGKKV